MSVAIAQRWRGYFFTPQPAFDLGMSRAVTCAALFVYYLPVRFDGWADVDPVFWMPQGVPYRIGLAVAPAPVLAVIGWTWKVALGLAAIGAFTRLAMPVVFVLGTYLLWLPHNFGKLDHDDAILPFVFAILSCSRCGDAVSVDAWWRRRHGSPVSAPSGEYRWPVRAVWLLLSLVFFAAGFSKLSNGGFDWVFGEQLRIVLLKEHVNGDPIVDWGLWIAEHPMRYRALAAATVVLELGYPLAMVSPTARLVFVPGMLVAQLAIRLLMGPAFWPFMICTAFWVPWRRLRRASARDASA